MKLQCSTEGRETTSGSSYQEAQKNEGSRNRLSIVLSCSIIINTYRSTRIFWGSFSSYNLYRIGNNCPAIVSSNHSNPYTHLTSRVNTCFTREYDVNTEDRSAIRKTLKLQATKLQSHFPHTEEGLSPKRLVYATIDTFKSFVSLTAAAERA